MDAADPGWRQLGAVLLEAGLLSEHDLAVALAEQAGSGRRLGEILVGRGLLSGAALANALAEQHGGLLRTEYGFGTGLRGLIAARGAPESASGGPEVGPQPSVAPPAGVRLASAGGSAEGQKSAEGEPGEVPDLAQPGSGTEVSTQPALVRNISSSEEWRDHDLEVQPLPQLDSHHLLFVPSAAGYLLLQRTGEAPTVGEQLEFPEAPNARLFVSKVARSPLPLDSRACAYLQAL